MMRRLLALILFVFACVSASEAAAAPTCERRQFENTDFLVCFYRSNAHELRIVNVDRAGNVVRTFSALVPHLGRDARRVQFAMNGGMFGTDGRPIGLYIESGKTWRRLNRVRSAHGNFYMQPNGVFLVEADGTARVVETDAYARRTSAPKWATQSGPMLVINGKLNRGFSADGPSRNIRNGVGELDGGVAAFVISEQPVSFGRFARFFRDALKSPNALYLDGAVSSIWVPALNRRDSGFDLGPLVVVLDKNR
jgi:uncharacterized protein YigE (DUF2233 family)